MADDDAPVVPKGAYDLSFLDKLDQEDFNPFVPKKSKVMSSPVDDKKAFSFNPVHGETVKEQIAAVSEIKTALDDSRVNKVRDDHSSKVEDVSDAQNIEDNNNDCRKEIIEETNELDKGQGPKRDSLETTQPDNFQGYEESSLETASGQLDTVHGHKKDFSKTAQLNKGQGHEESLLETSESNQGQGHKEDRPEAAQSEKIQLSKQKDSSEEIGSSEPQINHLDDKAAVGVETSINAEKLTDLAYDFEVTAFSNKSKPKENFTDGSKVTDDLFTIDTAVAGSDSTSIHLSSEAEAIKAANQLAASTTSNSAVVAVESAIQSNSTATELSTNSNTNKGNLSVNADVISTDTTSNDSGKQLIGAYVETPAVVINNKTNSIARD